MVEYCPNPECSMLIGILCYKKENGFQNCPVKEYHERKEQKLKNIVYINELRKIRKNAEIHGNSELASAFKQLERNARIDLDY